MIKDGVTIPHNETYDFILLDLVQDYMIQMNENAAINLTYYGLKELFNYDSFLQVSINNQLLETAHGDA